MKEVKKDTTEEKILEAAYQVFLVKGIEGSRMQEIADKAEINKALLHYYFRTKEKLFEAIRDRIFKQAFPGIIEVIISDLPIREKIEKFIDRYNEILFKNPFLPTFIIKEINRDPEVFVRILKSIGIDTKSLAIIFEKEMEQGNIRRMNPKDLIINILSMSIFPYVGKPIISPMLFDNDKKAYSEFLSQRNQSIKEFVLNAILIK